MKLKIKLQPMGEKIPKRGEIPKMMGEVGEKRFPMLYLNNTDIDGLDALSGGSKCQLVFEATVVGKTEREGENGKEDSCSVDFRLTKGKIFPLGKNGNYSSTLEAKHAALKDVGEYE